MGQNRCLWVATAARRALDPGQAGDRLCPRVKCEKRAFAHLQILAYSSLRDFTGAFGMRKLILETTAPFQGLPELVAYDEGLFAKEGLEIQWADREVGVEKKVEVNITSPKGVNPFASHGKLLEQGQADMYNA